MPEVPVPSPPPQRQVENKTLSSKDLVVLILVTGITWLFFLQSFRSIVVAAGVFLSLLPIIGALLIACILTILARRFLNSQFLAILGGTMIIVGRGFLLIPDETLSLYYVAMMMIFAGMPPFLGGLIGTYLYDEVPKIPEVIAVPRNILVLSLGGGLTLATGLSLLLRAPGIELMENPVLVMLFVFFDIIVLYRWSQLFPRKYFAVKIARAGSNPIPPESHTGRRTLGVLLLVPVFFYLVLIFDRPEWIAAASLVPYGWASYAVALSILAGSLCASILSTELLRNYLLLVLNGIGFVGLGLMFYLCPGSYLLVFIIGGTAGVGLFLSRFLSWWQQNIPRLRPNLAIFLVFLSLIIGAGVFFALQFEAYMPYLSIICSALLLLGSTYFVFTSKKAIGGGA